MAEKKDLSKIHPKKDLKGRWIIDIPKSVSGKRKRIYFPTQSEALLESGRIIFNLSVGGTIPERTQGKESIESLAASFIAERSLSVGSHTLRQLKWGVKMLTEKYGHLAPCDLSEPVAERWVSTLDLSTRGKFNVFAVCRTFFNSRPLKAVCAKNPFDKAPPKTDKGHRLGILTPDQMRVILSLDLPDWFRTWIICGGFAGLRTAEQQRLSFDALDFEFREIIVRKEQSKQGEAARPRSVTMQDAFVRQFAGKVFSNEGPLLCGKHPSDFSVIMPKVLKALKLDAWPKNCLRHSFASYHLAHFRDASNTAFNMGHTSPTLLYQTYANSVSRREAQEWWSI